MVKEKCFYWPQQPTVKIHVHIKDSPCIYIFQICFIFKGTEKLISATFVFNIKFLYRKNSYFFRICIYSMSSYTNKRCVFNILITEVFIAGFAIVGILLSSVLVHRTPMKAIEIFIMVFKKIESVFSYSPFNIIVDITGHKKEHRYFSKVYIWSNEIYRMFMMVIANSSGRQVSRYEVEKVNQNRPNFSYLRNNDFFWCLWFFLWISLMFY